MKQRLKHRSKLTKISAELKLYQDLLESKQKEVDQRDTEIRELRDFKENLTISLPANPPLNLNLEVENL